MSAKTPIVANNTPVFGWAFMLLWLAMLCAFSWLAIRDGGLPGHGAQLTALVFGIFWAFGIAGARYMLAVPRVRAVAGADGLQLEEIWLFKRRVSLLGRGAAQQLRIVEDRDDEGAPYFRCEARLPGERALTLKESHARDVVEDAYRKLMAAIGGQSLPNVSSKE